MSVISELIRMPKLITTYLILMSNILKVLSYKISNV